MNQVILRPHLERAFFVVERVVTAVLYPLYVLRERLGGPHKVPILMYHQISQPLNGVKAAMECVSPERFKMQIRALLAAGYRVIPLASLARFLEESPPEGLQRCVVLTFDDGFRDQFVHAYPILRQHGLPATFFLIAGYIGRDMFFPHLSLDDSRIRQRHQPLSGWLPLSWDDVKEMARNGIAIGSHTLSHRSCGYIDPQEAKEEVQRSKEVLEQRLGVRIEFFAYPFGSQAYGDFDQRVQEMVRNGGYRGACTTVVGRNGHGMNPLTLRRIPVEEQDGPFRLRCKLVGAYDWVGTVKALWQRLVAREERVNVTSVHAETAIGENRT
jgi:peptidoglycan/xylan/chitin deacetylase (PgdA/CDA1 family)